MARQNRVHYQNAYHHVMLRGNNRQTIFFDEQDYLDFMRYLRRACEKFGASIHLYCLMQNHAHIVIEVKNIPLSKIMHIVSTTYVMRHNKRYQKVGHLFQGRFKSKLIQDNNYLIELCYYIHMNPVKAGICDKPSSYRWCSHHAYLDIQNNEIEVKTEVIKNLLANSDTTYFDFMSNYKSDNLKSYYCFFDVEGVLTIKNQSMQVGSNEPALNLKNVSIRKIVTIISNEFSVCEDDLRNGCRSRDVTLVKAICAYYLHYHAGYLLADIAKYFCMHRSSLSKTLHSYLKNAKTDNKIQSALALLDSRLATSDVAKLVL